MISANNDAIAYNEAPEILFDPEKARADFPVLSQFVHGNPLVYLDNGASTQKPKQVINRIVKLYEEDYSNVHRGVHLLSQKSTQAFEASREKVKRFINAGSIKEIIFTKGTTDGINLIAQTYAREHLKEGDEILITAMEHHSNIVPWQMICNEKRAKLVVAPINQDGELLMEEFKKLLNPKTKLVSVIHMSNVLGTINPIREIVDLAHDQGAPVHVDGAQSAPHLHVDMQELDCDFFTFSAHKLYGPTGVGVLYGKKALLEDIPPYQGGGDMINSVSFEKTTYHTIPYKFEAGTPNIAGVIGMGEAIDYLESIDWQAALNYEDHLYHYAREALQGIKGLKLIGNAPQKTGLLSFTLDGSHPHDAGTILDREGIAVRVGHHCAQPLMDFYNVPATIRASFSFYNTREDVDRLIAGIQKVQEIFK